MAFLKSPALGAALALLCGCAAHPPQVIVQPGLPGAANGPFVVVGPTTAPATDGASPAATSAPTAPPSGPGVPVKLVNAGGQDGDTCAAILANGGLKDVIAIKEGQSKARALKDWVNSDDFGRYLREAYAASHSGSQSSSGSSSSGGFSLTVPIEGVPLGIGASSADSDFQVNLQQKDNTTRTMSLAEFRERFNASFEESTSERSASEVFKQVTNGNVVRAWKECIEATAGAAGLRSEISVVGDKILLTAKYVPAGRDVDDPEPVVQAVIVVGARRDSTNIQEGAEIPIGGVADTFTVTSTAGVSIVIQTTKGQIKQELLPGSVGVGGGDELAPSPSPTPSPTPKPTCEPGQTGKWPKCKDAPSPSPSPSPTATPVQAKRYTVHIRYIRKVGGWPMPLLVAAEDGGGGAVNVNRTKVGPWETFTLVDLDGGTLDAGDRINFQAPNGRFFRIQDDANRNVTATGGTEGGDAETVTLVSHGADRVTNGSAVSFKAPSGHYYSAYDGGGQGLVANKTAAGEWERFILLGGEL